MSETACEQYFAALRDYFRTAPYREWFDRVFEPLLNGSGASYYDGAAASALHTDLCTPLATNPPWTGLERGEGEALAREGIPLWHDLVECLQPDVLFVSIGRQRLGDIHFLPVEGQPIVLWASDSRPWAVEAVRRRLASGKTPLFVGGPPARTPFGRLSKATKRFVSEQVHQLLWRT